MSAALSNTATLVQNLTIENFFVLFFVKREKLKKDGDTSQKYNEYQRGMDITSGG